MNADLSVVLALLAVAIFMFAVGRPRMDAVGLLMLTALPLTGVLSMDEALLGFADGNVVLIAMLFVIGKGLVRTGVARRMGDLLIAKARNSDRRLVILLMLSVGALGAVMSSTGVRRRSSAGPSNPWASETRRRSSRPSRSYFAIQSCRPGRSTLRGIVRLCPCRRASGAHRPGDDRAVGSLVLSLLKWNGCGLRLAHPACTGWTGNIVALRSQRCVIFSRSVTSLS